MTRAALFLSMVLVLAPAMFTACGGADRKPLPANYGAGHARPHLMTEVAAMAPGKPDTLGIRFDIEPGWHLFWNGTNDTGYPISIQPLFPEGFETGELLWPAPERHESPGNILDHVYSGSVTLLLPFRAPEHLESGSWVTITCAIQWLSCRDACVPGQDELSLTLPVIDPESSEIDRSLWEGAVRAISASTEKAFSAARARIPREPGPLDAVIRSRWEDGDLVIEVPGAGGLAFYPGPGSTPLESILRDGVSPTETLRLRLAQDPGAATSVHGVLEITGGSDGTGLIYAVEFPLEET